MPSKSELYVQHLIDTLGDYSSIIGIETADPELGMVFGVIYHNYPEEGLLTGFTYGLSEANHPEWEQHKPELSITVASSQEDWAIALAKLVEWNRKDHSFEPGSLFHFGKAIATDSLMDSFLVFNLAIGDQRQFPPIQLEKEIIQIYGVYPLYHHEVDLIQKVGIRKFVEAPEYSVFIVQRPDLSQIYKVN